MYFSRSGMTAGLLTLGVLACLGGGTLASEGTAAPAAHPSPAPAEFTGVTPSTQVTLAGGNQKLIEFPIGDTYNYWKVAIANDGEEDLYFIIATREKEAYCSQKVPAHTAQSFYAEVPLESGDYLLTVHSADGSVELNGYLYYKLGTSFEKINN
ncbi:hypothetical protein D1159_05370 [Pseudoflavonifractor sp. 524-17]|uniref:hypothetical protein n=1 Tax=Pseudoflavonifractor sp. 524-17 TaxID=2304577 RepID=UPI001379743F|nr:hypothetical protein [Pseudoflavonifractor sp. 524-17]NCE64030.1 hypothetical protein [Pseudoflavonifractor sp. 524-17]